VTKRKGGPKRTNAPLWVTRDDAVVKLHKTMPSAARGPLLVVAHTADPLRVARHYLRTVWRFDAVALAAALAAQCPRPQGWTPAEAQAQADAAAKSLGPAHEKALRLALLNVH